MDIAISAYDREPPRHDQPLTPTDCLSIQEKVDWRRGLGLLYEREFGPPPDVVATQGRHLFSPPETPAFHPRFDNDFYKTLSHRLSSLEFKNTLRQRRYGPEAEESRADHTPQYVRNEWRKRHDEYERECERIFHEPSSEEDEDEDEWFPSRRNSDTTKKQDPPALSPGTSVRSDPSVHPKTPSDIIDLQEPHKVDGELHTIDDKKPATSVLCEPLALYTAT